MSDTSVEKRSYVGKRRGIKPGTIMAAETRQKIANSNVLRYLIDHVEGRREMTASQVMCGIALLKKVLPDLANVEHSGTDGAPLPVSIGVRLLPVLPANEVKTIDG